MVDDMPIFELCDDRNQSDAQNIVLNWLSEISFGEVEFRKLDALPKPPDIALEEDDDF